MKIIDYETPRDGRDYMVLESISSTVNKVIHVVDLYHCNSFFIGRGLEADVKITDITVSRLHATIFMKKSGKIYLSDNSSKYGTLLQV